MSDLTLMQKVKRLLAKLHRQNVRRGWKARDKRVKAAQDDLTPPKRIVFPGVRAARDQSAVGGFPGSSDHSNPGADWCLKFVRLCYGIPAREADAIAAWRTAKHKHPQTDAAKIPRGYPVFWEGGSASHGHIAISAGNGFCWSTDIRRTGFMDRVPIDEIRAKWGLTLLGWTEDINGVTVPAEAVK